MFSDGIISIEIVYATTISMMLNLKKLHHEIISIKIVYAITILKTVEVASRPWRPWRVKSRSCLFGDVVEESLESDPVLLSAGGDL